jgi:hypothetical protein
VPDQIALHNEFVVPEVVVLHVTKSVEVKTVPLTPTTTYREPDEATLSNSVFVPEVRVIQELPSLDVIMVPLAPTATN